jgi:hypothetical protein
MVAPASGQIAEDFAITSKAVVAMTVSVFVLAYGGVTPVYSLIPIERLIKFYLALGPLVLGPLSEVNIS